MCYSPSCWQFPAQCVIFKFWGFSLHSIRNPYSSSCSFFFFLPILFIYLLTFLLPFFAQLKLPCPFALSVLFSSQPQNCLPRRHFLDQSALHFPAFCCQPLCLRKPIYLTNFLRKMALKRVSFDSCFCSLKSTPYLVDLELVGKHGFFLSSFTGLFIASFLSSSYCAQWAF